MNLGRKSPGTSRLSSIDEPLTLSEATSPGPALSAVKPKDSDLPTNAGTGQEAMGQHIIIRGRVLDEQGKPVPGVLNVDMNWKETSGKWEKQTEVAPYDQEIPQV